MKPIDDNLIEVMNYLFQTIKDRGDYPGTDDQLKMEIVASNLKGLANVLIELEDHPDIRPDSKKTALGLLGTADWLMEGIPND